MQLDQYPQQTLTHFGCVGYSMYACRFSVPQMRQFYIYTYIPSKIKMSFIWKDVFFFAKIGIFCKSMAGQLHSVVQAHTQPYSFGGRIKLIICQIRHELCITIHEISTCWKKKLDGGSITKLQLFDVFFAKIGIFCESIAGLLSEAYTQPYSFRGRITLISCQIRHELGVNIYEISTSWKKKNVSWRTHY